MNITHRIHQDLWGTVCLTNVRETNLFQDWALLKTLLFWRSQFFYFVLFTGELNFGVSVAICTCLFPLASQQSDYAALWILSELPTLIVHFFQSTVEFLFPSGEQVIVWTALRISVE